MRQENRKKLLKIYRLLYKRFGPQRWWPGDTRFEIIVGAILTQNTNWGNVEKAIKNLKKAKALNVKALTVLSKKSLASLIRPAGYFNIKAGRLKNFVDFLNCGYKGSLKKMLSEDPGQLRKRLLEINGIGPETADSILLYAGEKAVFVVDNYTKRVFLRHGFIDNDSEYSEVQEFFLKNLPKNVSLFNEYHALIVELGKNICKSKKPLCSICPITEVKNG
ncbi:MAG: endonuclease III domain-containing protein [Candidatus Omnitrophota bacterium]